ncbi:N-acetyltransferase [Acaryochloris sp. IP29b_bin.148]|uniref:GNAT family N-acetyltransferase n=1 Tax=Acaryochloris sp. IP29b_bin.148 TaxID=2969218 RepID=UPI0026093C3E|nr:GNAT family N-acetyltransferase [Acaryochloris sp. IP29b_bin.148]
MEYRLRPASELDCEFLFMLHSTTMRDVIETTWGWDETWQRTDFDRRFAVQNVSIIEATSFDVGGLWIEWKPDSLYIHEIQIVPDYQDRGLGTAVIQDVVGQAASRMLPVELSVVPANPRAKHLYERLGFVMTSVESPFIQMRYDAHLG